MVNLPCVRNIALDLTGACGRADVAVAIVRRRLHVPRPDPQTRRFRRSLGQHILIRIIAVGGGQPRAHQNRPDIKALHRTTRHSAAIAVGVHGGAIGAITLIQFSNLCSRPVATGPGDTPLIGAKLPDLRRINAEQAHPDAADIHGVAVDHLQHPERIRADIGRSGKAQQGQTGGCKDMFEHDRHQPPECGNSRANRKVLVTQVNAARSASRGASRAPDLTGPAAPAPECGPPPFPRP